MRIMGLDIGSKRIGVALSDELMITAQGFPTLQRTSEQKDIQKLFDIAKEHSVEKIVAGLPKNMDGTLGESAEQVLAFVEKVKESTSIPVELWDERLSTVAAERVLIEMDVSRRKRAERIDSAAASFILQGALDRLASLGRDALSD